MKMSRIRIGGLYLSSDHFADEANKTIGKPALSDQVIVNRRNVTPKLNPYGEEMRDNVRKIFSEQYDLEVEFSWSKHCGCTTCPCSPGFKIFIRVPANSMLRVREENRVNVWVDNDGKITIRDEDKIASVIQLMKLCYR